MLHRAVEADEIPPGEREARPLDRAFRPHLAGLVPLDLRDRGIAEERDVEGHRVLGGPGEHQVRRDLTCHLDLAPLRGIGYPAGSVRSGRSESLSPSLDRRPPTV